MKNFERDGIPWEELFDKIDTGRAEGSVLSKSSKHLAYHLTKNDERTEFEIFDANNPHFHQKITTEHEINTFSLNLHTKGTEEYESQRHPDMSGKEFVRNSLALMHQINGYSPNTFIGDWLDVPGYDDNFRQYIQGLQEGMNPIGSAKNTWIGRILSEHGYTGVTESGIMIFPKLIIVKFSKVEKSK